ncbi:hypothetical protein [Infirmifilum uzonense]|uniref:hypothetical protein n=1 Tax=Infirmifilum uzonense TaxID=1550241 RepID=UPI003C77D27D
MCGTRGLEVNADLNPTLNIAHKAGYSPTTPVKVEAFLTIHKGVAPLTEKKNTNTRSKTITPRRVTGSRHPWRRPA